MQQTSTNKKPLIVSEAQVKTVDVLEADCSEDRDAFADEGSAPTPPWPGDHWWPGRSNHDN